jgi:hypothetical protein
MSRFSLRPRFDLLEGRELCSVGLGTPPAPPEVPLVTTATITAAQEVTLQFAPVPTTAVVGQPLTLAVTATLDGGGVPTGTVTFKDRGTAIGTATLNAAGQAQFAAGPLTLGTHSFTAEFGGETAVGGNTVVSRRPTTVTLTPSDTTPGRGDTVTLTATVAGPAGNVGTPTGSVVFRNGSTVLGTATVNAQGKASVAVPLTLSGRLNYRADYQGDANSLPSSGTLSLDVDRARSVTTLTASASEITPTESVTFKATVLSAVATGSPVGSVTFRVGVGGQVLGTATINGRGEAVLTVTGANLPQYDGVVAEFAGSSLFAGSTSSPVTVTVVDGDGDPLPPPTVPPIKTTGAATTTVLTAPTGPVAAGQPVTLSAKVTTQASGSPIGTVTFVAGDGAVLGSAALNGNGVATLTRSALPAGVTSITAVYSGSSLFAGSISAPVTVGEGSPGGGGQVTGVTIQVPDGPIVYGAPVSLTVTAAGATGGTVTLYEGTRAVGTATVGADGKAQVPVQLGVGTRKLTATYSDGGSVSLTSAPVSLTIGAAPTTVAVTGPTSAAADSPVTLTAQVVAPAGGQPIGTVTFKLDGQVIGTGTVDGRGRATFSVAGLAAGTRHITATYSGSSCFLTSESVEWVLEVV